MIISSLFSHQMTCLKFKGGKKELSHTNTSKNKLVMKRRLEPSPDFFSFNSKGFCRFLLLYFPVYHEWTHSKCITVRGQLREPALKIPGVETPPPQEKASQSFLFSFPKIQNYYFLNNKKSALSGPLTEVQHTSLKAAMLGQHSAPGQTICYQPHENKVKHPSQTILGTINKG